ncbi:carbohydrate-binding family 9-like protein [Paenibacillus allorhizosphaerae]|uniref:Carbohydrate-binding domain-containing protein n=1 Tax=Paenibacillus allorhizosphaerae TaxID=2849866 RepID=A0ABN7TRH6_9BACL|nr:carbohydrate-binding family 9-like protein [Paenibacillus allorhizosphaerae]CAG7652715.1 hypothetical protein PAECIP111802_05312 [Paenibacillus allorhizosphaerae]
MTTERYIYRCMRVPSGQDDIHWNSLPTLELVDSPTGEQPALRTFVQSCWDSRAVYFRFKCQDDFVISTFTDRDDPLYEQDVVEIFIDETGMGTHYKEIEVSPNNVIFDALVTNHNYTKPGGRLDVDTSWNMEGLQTSVTPTDGGFHYQITMPFSQFSVMPDGGDCWRINFYRIDQEKSGTRHYCAWSPTYHPSFHVSERFGTLLFD